MSPNYAQRVAALPVLVALALTGCTAEPEAETYVSAPAETPQPTLTPNAVEADTVLVIRALATADNGAQLDLELQVHQSTSWDYAGTATLPAALVDDCAGTLTEDQFATEAWSFTRANLTAIPTGASTAEWPGIPISIEPSANYAMIAGRELLATPATDTSLCLTSKTFAGAGRGAIAVGIPSDAATLTGWSRHPWGFSVEGATLSNCTISATTLGGLFGAGTGWTEAADDATCVTGPATQTSEF